MRRLRVREVKKLAQGTQLEIEGLWWKLKSSHSLIPQCLKSSWFLSVKVFPELCKEKTAGEVEVNSPLLTFKDLFFHLLIRHDFNSDIAGRFAENSWKLKYLFSSSTEILEASVFSKSVNLLVQDPGTSVSSSVFPWKRTRAVHRCAAAEACRPWSDLHREPSNRRKRLHCKNLQDLEFTGNDFFPCGSSSIPINPVPVGEAAGAALVDYICS